MQTRGLALIVLRTRNVFPSTHQSRPHKHNED